MANQRQYQAATFDTHLSDHRAQCLTIEILQSSNMSPTEKRDIRVINNNNLNLVTADLEQVDWTAAALTLAFDRFFDIMNT